MDIQLTEEQELLRNSVQRLLRDRYDFGSRRKVVATEDALAGAIRRAVAIERVPDVSFAHLPSAASAVMELIGR